MRSLIGQHEWPWEHPAKGGLRPWYATATGYLMVLFRDPAEAERARRDLLLQGVADDDVRLHQADETLRIHERLQEHRSSLAKAIAAHGSDHTANERYLENAKAGGAALWVIASTKDRANRLVGLLADFDYLWLRYFGDHNVEDITPDVE